MFRFSSLASLIYYMIILPMNVSECIRTKTQHFITFLSPPVSVFSIKKYSRKHRLPCVYLIILLYHWKTHNLSRRPKWSLKNTQSIKETQMSHSNLTDLRILLNNFVVSRKIADTDGENVGKVIFIFVSMCISFYHFSYLI